MAVDVLKTGDKMLNSIFLPWDFTVNIKGRTKELIWFVLQCKCLLRLAQGSCFFLKKHL